MRLFILWSAAEASEIMHRQYEKIKDKAVTKEEFLHIYDMRPHVLLVELSLWVLTHITLPLITFRYSLDNLGYVKSLKCLPSARNCVALEQGSSNLSLEGRSAAEFSSTPDQTHLPVISNDPEDAD